MAYIKLKDIALKAGVSVNTVSRALHDKPDIGTATKRRIREIADAMGYIPNQSASNLRSSHTDAVGIIVTHLNNAFFSQILQGMNDALVPTGHTILTLASNEDPLREQELLKTLYANRIGGLLIVPARDLAGKIDYDTIKTPHIVIVRPGKANSQNYFVTDSLLSGKLAARRFIDTGRKQPAYIGYNMPVSCNENRLIGFRSELAARGVALEEYNILLCDALAGEAYTATLDLLERSPAIDSLFVYNDQMAIGVLRALQDRGRMVPDDISVIGHDDIQESRFYSPALTSIRVPQYELGFQSASCLLDILGGKAATTHRVTYKPELIIRET